MAGDCTLGVLKPPRQACECQPVSLGCLCTTEQGRRTSLEGPCSMTAPGGVRDSLGRFLPLPSLSVAMLLIQMFFKSC